MSEHEQNAVLPARHAPGVREGAIQEQLALERGWELARVAPGAFESPAQLDAARADFRPAVVPGTVALADSEAAASLDLDAWDHWYRCRFDRPNGRGGRVLLSLSGLATLADVYLNGRLIAQTANMFEEHAFDVGAALEARNELCIRFRALAPVLKARRPRGRWPTRLVTEKNLRFVRTTLLGYMPGFCPTLRPVGPWRAVQLVVQREIAAEHVRLVAGLEAARGVLEAEITCRVLSGDVPSRVELAAAGARAELAVERIDAQRCVLRGRLQAAGVQSWWPHTHGAPHLYPVSLRVDLGASSHTLELGAVGFRSLEIDNGAADDFGLRVNGERVFCRGACWTPLDLASLHASESDYRDALELVRDAGMNMLRISGNMVYEADAFYRLCDELGIMVWQDFMFANMDYPVDDPEFVASCRTEASQFLERTTGRACLAMLCGNSEVAQQAVMMGMSTNGSPWNNALFDTVLAELCAQQRPDVPYVGSSPSGGALPFHTGPGPSHYYGVGAYLRPIDDARLRHVRFASECLAFSVPPDDETLLAFFGDESVPVHDPRYKARVPRDPGAGWDFADVTDHYVQMLFEVDPRRLRYADQERYLALCRVAAAEAMSQVQGLWRPRASRCGGALIWFLRDLWQGAGLGLIDASGAPKATYYHLKRAWAPLALWFVDEGTDGLALHAANDRGVPCSATLELALYRPDGAVVERIEHHLTLEPRSEQSFDADALIGRFVDASYAYRFGPPAHSLVAARLLPDAQGAPPLVASRAFHLPLGLAHDPSCEVGLAACARARRDGSFELTVSAERFAQSVRIEARGYQASDNYFHLAPRESHRLVLTPKRGPEPLRGKIRALNASKPAAIRIDPNAGQPPATPARD